MHHLQNPQRQLLNGPCAARVNKIVLNPDENYFNYAFFLKLQDIKN